MSYIIVSLIQKKKVNALGKVNAYADDKPEYLTGLI